MASPHRTLVWIRKMYPFFNLSENGYNVLFVGTSHLTTICWKCHNKLPHLYLWSEWSLWVCAVHNLSNYAYWSYPSSSANLKQMQVGKSPYKTDGSKAERLGVLFLESQLLWSLLGFSTVFINKVFLETTQQMLAIALISPFKTPSLLFILSCSPQMALERLEISSPEGNLSIQTINT